MTPVPLDILRRYPALSWSELCWGYDHGLLGWQTVAQLAKNRLSTENNDLVRELADVGKSDIHRVGPILHSLSSSVGESQEAKELWAFLSLSALFESDVGIEQRLTGVEAIYADFEYLPDIASFVGYMPVTDGYKPELHSRPENQARLFALWRQYLEKYDQKLRARMGMSSS